MPNIKIDDARKIALEYVAKHDPEAQKAEIVSVKRKGKGWHVEVSWEVSGQVSGVQHAEVTLTKAGVVEGFEKTKFFGGAVIHRT
jgi:hypothetical protein